MKRSFVPAASLVIFSLLLVPPVASASTWVVKDAGGHKRGTVRNTHGLARANVKHKNGSWAGWVSRYRYDAGSYLVNLGRPHTVIGEPLVWVKNGRLHPGSGSTAVIGKVVKKNGRWRVYKFSSGFRKVGSVPGACPRAYAMGAGSLLLWGRW